MTLKISFEQPSSRATHAQPLNPLRGTQCAPGRRSFRSVLSEDLRRQQNQSFGSSRQVPSVPTAASAEPKQGPELRTGLLSRLFSILRGHGSTPRQLRLLETVPLGEKRFVALVSAEGHKFLIGGGSSGVSLLTRIDEPTAAEVESTATPVPKPVEVSELRHAPEIVSRPLSFVELAGVAE